MVPVFTLAIFRYKCKNALKKTIFVALSGQGGIQNRAGTNFLLRDKRHRDNHIGLPRQGNATTNICMTSWTFLLFPHLINSRTAALFSPGVPISKALLPLPYHRHQSIAIFAMSSPQPDPHVQCPLSIVHPFSSPPPDIPTPPPLPPFFERNYARFLLHLWQHQGGCEKTICFAKFRQIYVYRVIFKMLFRSHLGFRYSTVH